MKSDRDEILELMTCYTNASGIGLYCLDQTLEIQSISTVSWIYHELESFDFNEVSSYIQQKASDPTRMAGCFEVITTQHDFVYLIRDLKTGRTKNAAHWFLVSEPMMNRYPSGNGMTRPGNAMPIISTYRIDQLGKTLDYLCIPFSSNRGACRRARRSDLAMRGCMTDLVYPDRADEAYQQSQTDVHSTAKFLYVKVMEIIRNGHVHALLDMDKHIDFNKTPLQQMVAQDALLVAKDIFIAFCTMQFQCAVDAGLPYVRMLRLADQQISQVQRMQQVQDVLAQMKSSVAAFTYAVHLDLVDRQKDPVLSFHHDLMAVVCPMPVS